MKKPELDAKLVADSIASQLERRVMFRRAMKRAVQNAMRLKVVYLYILFVRTSIITLLKHTQLTA